MRKVLCWIVAAGCAAASTTSRVFAQTQTRVPPGVIFGGAVDAPTSGPSLNLFLNVAQAYDQDVVEHFEDTTVSLFQGSGFYQTLTPRAEFQSGQGRLRFAVNTMADSRYYKELGRLFVTTHSTGAGLIAQITHRTSVSLNGNATYSSSLFSGLLAGAAAPAATAAPSASSYLLNANPSYTYTASADVTHRVSRRLSVSFDSSFHYTDFTAKSLGYSDIRFGDASGRASYSLNPNFDLRLGYSAKAGEYDGSPQSTEQHADIGLTYSRLWSKTRKTTVAVTLGPTKATGALNRATAADIRQQYRFIGEVFVTHPVGRTWIIQSSYHRGIGYIEGLQGPVYSTTYTATSGGFLNRRTDVTLSAAYSSGEPALNGTASQFTTYSGNAQVRFGLNRICATFLEYSLYDYKFNRDIQIPSFVPPTLARNGIKVGLVLWAPVRHF